MSKMKSSDYHEGYWERGEGSNYIRYGDDPGWVATLATMRQYHPDGLSLLEFGCSKGFFVWHAVQMGYDAYGCDISEYAIGCAEEPYKDRVTQANAVNVPYEPYFDVICSWEFLEHIYQDELTSVLGEMMRLSHPGTEWWHRIGIELPGDPAHQQDDITHYNEKPEKYWRDTFDEYGLQRLQDKESALNRTFVDRDWAGRFFVYGVPSG